MDLDTMDDDTKDSLTYKKKKELKLKKASEQADTWNTLFIRSDTVGALCHLVSPNHPHAH
jgi:hypothetical protein